MNNGQECITGSKVHLPVSLVLRILTKLTNCELGQAPSHLVSTAADWVTRGLVEDSLALFVSSNDFMYVVTISVDL